MDRVRVTPKDLGDFLDEQERLEKRHGEITRGNCRKLTSEGITAINAVISGGGTAVVIPTKAGIRINHKTEKTVYKTEEKA